jgi:hypothetical protein
MSKRLLGRPASARLSTSNPNVTIAVAAAE